MPVAPMLQVRGDGCDATVVSDLCSLPKGVKAPRVPKDLLQLNCIVYTELAIQNAWTFTAGAGAPVDVGNTVTVRAQGNIETNSS